MTSLFKSVSGLELASGYGLLCFLLERPAGGGHHFPLLQQQFKHIESLLILKLASGYGLLCPVPERTANTWEEVIKFHRSISNSTHIAAPLISKLKTNGVIVQVSFMFRTRLCVWIALSCARAGSQHAGGGHLF